MATLWSSRESSGLKEEIDRAKEKDRSHTLALAGCRFPLLPHTFTAFLGAWVTYLLKILTPLLSPYLTFLFGEMDSKIARAWINYTYLVEFK